MMRWRAWPWPADVECITGSTRIDLADWVLWMDDTIVDSTLHVWRLP